VVPTEGRPVQDVAAKGKRNLRRTLIMLAAALGGAFVLVLVLSHVMAMSTSRVHAVTQWADHTTPDQTITASLPANWHVTEGTAQGLKTRLTAQQSSLIGVSVVGSDALSFMGDISKTASAGFGGASTESDTEMPGMGAASMGMPGTGGSAADATPPEQKVHGLSRKEFEHRYPGYKEGPKQELIVGGSPACLTEITFARRCVLINMEMRGVRITALGPQRGYSIVAYCPAQAYEDFEPVVSKLLAGLRLQ
jgi:hypothetical protein